jgi:hypothetical protein
MQTHEEKCDVGDGSIGNYVMPDIYQNLIFLQVKWAILLLLEAAGSAHEGGTNGASPCSNVQATFKAQNLIAPTSSCWESHRNNGNDQAPTKQCSEFIRS